MDQTQTQAGSKEEYIAQEIMMEPKKLMDMGLKTIPLNTCHPLEVCQVMEAEFNNWEQVLRNKVHLDQDIKWNILEEEDRAVKECKEDIRWNILEEVVRADKG